MPGASLALFADLGACHVQKSSVTICVLPTPSGWRATLTSAPRRQMRRISIHALRVEGDRVGLLPRLRDNYFYLRPPGGGRLAARRIQNGLDDFYPRPPGGGRRMRADGRSRWSLFLSTPSGWRATVCDIVAEEEANISIHALRVEGDSFPRPRQLLRPISIHALRVEGDPGTVGDS